VIDNKGDANMLTRIDVLVHLEHHKDLLREAKQERLALLAESARSVKKADQKTGIHSCIEYLRIFGNFMLLSANLVHRKTK
jgi:hypothetical protein